MPVGIAVNLEEAFFDQRRWTLFVARQWCAFLAECASLFFFEVSLHVKYAGPNFDEDMLIVLCHCHLKNFTCCEDGVQDPLNFDCCGH